ncbi:hypothetical protein BN2537_16407 [Streptomyces venezuelae]|nr:hypothetical protein BN2537_16407 [Streptomyces venezuelae]
MRVVFLRGNDLDELRQHSHQRGHVGFCENDDIKAPGATEVVEGAEPTGGKSGKAGSRPRPRSASASPPL